MKKQNTFIGNIRTISVYGIFPEAMGSMHQKMTIHKSILDIGATAKTTELGQWNVYTTTSHFAETTKWFLNNLTNLYEDSDHDLKEVPPSFTPQV